MTVAFNSWQESAFAQAAIHGAIAAAVAITVRTCWVIVRPHFEGSARGRVVLIAATAFLLYTLTAIPAIDVLLLAAAVGAALPIGPRMKILLLYLLLLKATATAFAGLASLPVVQDELVIKRHLLTDKQLNEAIVITRSTPGPVGLYVVSVGYFAAGWPGALAGWLAMITPALLIIPLVHFAGRKAEHPMSSKQSFKRLWSRVLACLSSHSPGAQRAHRPRNHRNRVCQFGSALVNGDRHALDNSWGFYRFALGFGAWTYYEHHLSFGGQHYGRFGS